MNIQSDLNEIQKIGNISGYQKEIIYNIGKFFYLQEKIINLFRGYSFLLSESKYKAKHGGRLKYQLINKCFTDYH